MGSLAVVYTPPLSPVYGRGDWVGWVGHCFVVVTDFPRELLGEDVELVTGAEDAAFAVVSAFGGGSEEDEEEGYGQDSIERTERRFEGREADAFECGSGNSSG